MSLPQPYRKKPAVLAKSWPPHDYVNKLEVDLSDNWTSLAGSRDPWRLILYNFRTHDPDEVNWYLYHWVGCRAVTADGKNYRFSSFDDRLGPGASTPLYIYIPHTDWEPEHDEEARELVHNTLSGATAKGIHFSCALGRIRSGDIGDVAELVDSRKIQVSFAPGLRSHNAGAKYVQADNHLLISSLRTDLGARSRILHEAVHAAFDKRRGDITAIDEEAIAYVAQCIYLQKLGGAALPAAQFDWKPLATAAWPIATVLRTGSGTVASSDIDALRSAVRTAYPHLAAAPSSKYTHNGIG